MDPLLSRLRRRVGQVSSEALPIGPARRLALETTRREADKRATMGSEQSACSEQSVEAVVVQDPPGEPTGKPRTVEHKHTQTNPFDDEGFDMTVSRKWLRVLGRVGLLGKRRGGGPIPGSDEEEQDSRVFCCGDRVSACFGRF